MQKIAATATATESEEIARWCDDCVSGSQVDPHVNCSEYDQLTERDWVDYEFDTIAYDYGIHPKAVDQIRKLFDRLVKSDGS